MDSRIDDSGVRSFRETKNFSTQNSNNGWMDFFEGYEYLSVATSSGEMADRIYADIPSECHRDSIDVHNKNVVEVSCFRDHLQNNFIKYFGHLSVIKKYWESVDENLRSEFIDSLEVASRAGNIRPKPYDLTEIRVTVTILSYLQSIFFMFDRNNPNGLADGVEVNPGDSELRRAEKHFRPLIVDFVLKNKPEVIKEKRSLFGVFLRQRCF